MSNEKTWELIHQERSATADLLAGLAPGDWEKPHFLARMAANGFRFNTTMDRDARSAGTRAPAETVQRLRATTSTTNRPPATVATMLGEIVVHTEDIRRPLGLTGNVPPEAITGRTAFVTDLDGDGVATLRERMPAA